MTGKKRKIPAKNRSSARAQQELPEKKTSIGADSNRSSLIRLIQILAVSSIALALFYNTLSNGFILDDELFVVRNLWIRDWRLIPEMFAGNVWSFANEEIVSNYYRPFMHLTFLTTYYVFGLKAWGFHLVNVLFHAANTVLLLLLSQRLTGCNSKSTVFVSIPFMAALLFAAHPVHTEAVAWIASLPELLMTFFYLLSFYFYAGPVRPSGLRLTASVAFFTLALISKEPALTLPGLLLVYDIALRKEEQGMKHRLIRYIPYLTVAVIYLAIRYSVLHAVLAAKSWQPGLRPFDLVINVFPLFSSYLRVLLIPVDLRYWYSFHPIHSLATTEGVFSLVVCLAFGFALVLSWKRHRLSFLCLTLIALPLLPALYIGATPLKPFAERYAYLPSAGFVILAGIFLHYISRFPRMKIPALVVLAGVTLLYSGGTIKQNRVWKDVSTLYADTTSKSPDAPVPCDDLLDELMSQGRADEAIILFDGEVKKNPNSSVCQSALGTSLLAKGRLNEAIERLNVAISIDPNSLASHNDLAIALRKKGDLNAAIAQFNKALAINPDFGDAHFNLAGVLADTGQMAEAMEHYRAAVRLRPENIFYKNVLGIEYVKQGQLSEAIEQFQEAVRLDPSEPASARNLQRALDLQKSGNTLP